MKYSNQVLPSYLINTPYDIHNRKRNSILLPTKLNKNDCADELTIEDDELTMFYNVQEHQDWFQAAAVRADYPLPVEAGLFYFEVYIINQGLEGLIGIGMSEPNVNLRGQPGWNERSYGYHGDDGLKFISNGHRGYDYGPLYTNDDIIGCCVNFFNNTCFYTKNGINLGVAFDDITGGDLYPSFGMRNPKARIEVNFGQKPFVFDIDQYAKKIFQDAKEKNEWANLSEMYK
ncbi:concanavalin A-like lectin/glucanase domain-containing protein [Glomus cerebriforme]|uniref:Concanavalin A-like lectin/glucanase domain-containing protein n=1 Tax=Glomus cerebriforme TaxID=658196 RepID=A0A397SYE1_9GLOM|nr:concanavalin A-like lectin/glucanase domain-containing protein [Glomus cerebriforme]